MSRRGGNPPGRRGVAGRRWPPPHSVVKAAAAPPLVSAIQAAGYYQKPVSSAVPSGTLSPQGKSSTSEVLVHHLPPHWEAAHLAKGPAGYLHWRREGAAWGRVVGPGAARGGGGGGGGGGPGKQECNLGGGTGRAHSGPRYE
ncbi:natriuretic peptide-like [Schistocerca americana]|uniref:natriuretic peptide-like n=1 Tax=Schistocerca americana TaxID=7009 RepID=UPI001F4F3DF7|nr:natriuretic peptide-like [Schistocerca americana]